MSVEQLIKYLRISVNIQDPDASSKDPEYLSMTDEDLRVFLDVACSMVFPYTPLEDISEGDVYGILLLARKDLYYTLATIDAPLYDIGADNNNYLKRSQRFDHYMKLIAQTDKEYQDYLENGGAGGNVVTTYNTFIPSRYNTVYNYEKSPSPKISLFVDNVTEDSVEIRWSYTSLTFYKFFVYLSDSKIVDPYLVGKPKIVGDVEPITEISDSRQNKCRIEGLNPNTEYHVAVCIEDKSTLLGYSEKVFSTLDLKVVNING